MAQNTKANVTKAAKKVETFELIISMGLKLTKKQEQEYEACKKVLAKKEEKPMSKAKANKKEIEEAKRILEVKALMEKCGVEASREQKAGFKKAEAILGLDKAAAPDEKEVDIKKFEPKTGKDGEYRWDSYKACRSAYCYTMQGCKVWKGKVTKPDGWTFNEKQWEKDKAFFGKTFVYVKKADR